MGNSQIMNYFGSLSSHVANALANQKTVMMNCGQNVAGAIMHDGQMAINAAKGYSASALEHGKQVVNDISQHSINDMVAGGRNTIQNGYNHITGTPVNQLAGEVRGAVMGSAPVEAMQNGYTRARGYGKTLLGDIDQFYHNADGSYNRTKVGATIGAGLGIAGIAGYNMNN